MTQDTPDIPEHITPQAIYQMTDEQHEAMLDGLRNRRLNAVRVYEQAQKEAQELADDRARADLMKQCEMCENNISRVDKAIDALETRVNKIRALRMQLGLD